MARKKPIISPLGQWAYPGEVTIIPSSDITMKGVNYPVLGIDDLGNQQMMMPGQDYTFPGNYVTEIPQMGKGGLAQWFDEKWVDVKTGKACGRSGKDKDGRPYPACRPSKRVNETTPKTTSEMSSSEKAKFKREKTSGKRIDYNHKRREEGGETGWLDEFQVGGVRPPIYTSDLSKVRSYNDSNTLYNSYLGNLERLKKIGQPIQTNDATIKSNYTVQKDNTIKKTDTKRMIRRWDESSEGKISPLEYPVVPKISSLEDLNYDPIQQKYQTKSFPGRSKNIPGKILEDNMYNQYVRQWYLTQGPDKISTMPVSPDTDEVIKRNLKEPQANLFAHMDATHKHIKPIGIDKVYLDPVIQENYKALIQYKNNRTVDSSGNIVSDSGWNPVDSNINFETKTLNNNPLFIRRYAKPFQPYIYTETPVAPAPVVEPPKPSLFVSNIDRDMYTPGGGMAREYNIGVTLQDGNRRSFRTEKEYQDWKAANNLDISKAKVTEGRGYSYDYYPENKKYGGWLNQYQDGGTFLEDIKDPIVIPTTIPQTQKTSFWDLMSYQKDPNNPGNYIKVNKNPNYYKFNSKLDSSGDPEVQAYQNYLNENFNLFVKEDGVWNDETKKAYEKYVTNNENPKVLNNKSIKIDNKQPLEFRYENGSLQVKAVNPEYNPDLENWTDLKKLNPTLEEFRSIVDKLPSYNKYYENIYDVDNSIRGIQAGPLDRQRKAEIDATKSYQELDPKYKEYLGKTFGTLPIVEKEGIYEGYSPSRIWTTPPGSSSKPWLGDDEVYNPSTDLRYLYFLKPKEGSIWSDEKYQKELENLNCINGNCGDSYLNKGNSTFSAPSLNLPKKKAKKFLPSPTGDTWKLGQQAYVEMLSNPEILKYAKEKGIDLTDLGKDQYSPILAEAIIGKRDAEFNNKGVVIPHSRKYVPVIQDPNQFDLAGYLPITLDMFSANMNPDARNQALLNWDKKAKAEYFKRAGIPEDQWDQVYIHTSPFSIDNYTPGKKYGGWLNKYQPGGYVKYVPPSQRPLTFQSSNPSTTDNTRLVTQNTNVTPANRKAAEAAQYARKVGSISQGTRKSDYEKAREASSLVAQAQQRKGSADPLDYVLDMVNPAFLPFAGIDLVGNTAMGVNNLVKGNFSEAAGNALDASLNALNVIPAAAELRGPLKSAGKYLTTQTPLKNTYKYNPWAFKPNEANWYRQVGKSAIDDIQQTGLIREAGEEVSPRMWGEFQNQIKRLQGDDAILDYNERYMQQRLAGRRPVSPFFAKGELFYPMDKKVTMTKSGKISKNPAAKGTADYLIETDLANESFQPAYVKGMYPGVPEEIGSTAILKPNPALRNIDNFKLYKQDWFRGYKPIDVPSAQPSMNLSNMDGVNIAREFLGELVKGNQNRKAIAEGNAWLKNWIDDPITQTKIDTDLGWIPQRSNILKDKFSLGYEQAKSFTPVSKEYPLLQQLNDYFIGRPHIHSGNTGVSYLHSRDPYLRSISELFNNPRLKASWISRNPSRSKPVRRSTTVHEGTHDWTSDFLLRESGQMGDIRNLYSNDVRNLTDQYKSLTNSGINPFEVMGRENATLGYLADPTEVHARIMQLRQLMKMTPEQSVMVTPEKAADIITKVQNPKNTKFIDPRFLDVIDKDPKKLATLFNRLWAVPAVAAASQLPEQKNGGWLNNYQDGGENLPELNSKIDIANFYKNPLSEKYGIYQDPTDKGYKYYLKSAEETNIPLKTFDFSGLNNIAKKINKKEIVSPEVIKYNPRIKDYTSDQDYLMESATKEFPIIPPSYEDVLSSIPKSERLNTIPKPKTLPNKQPVVNNTSVQNNFTFDSNYWSSPDIQAEIFNRQLKDNKWYGDFDKRGDNVLNRTDVKRNYDSEIFLQNLATPNSVVIDIGSALGNNNAQLAGVSVYELASNPKIKNKNIKVIATDIPSEVKGFEELKRRGNKVYPIDYAQVPETFNTPVRDILKSKNLENVKDVYLRAANSIDLLMNVQETSEHFKHISSSLKDKNVTYLYNNVILYKPAGSTKFKKLGNLNNSAFDHRAPTWKNNPNRNHYTLLPTNATGGQTGWLNKYK